MNKIINFNTEEEFAKYLFSKVVQKLGEGSEGSCFRGRDGLAYKESISGPKLGFPKQNYNLNNIITTSDINNESFAFPHVLFAINGEFAGCTSNLVSCNYIDATNLLKYGIDEVDFDALIDAYYVMKEDVIKLANDGILIYDLTFNLMFDGIRLVGVDTCGYKKTNEDVVLENISRLDNAIKSQFEDCMLDNYDYDINEEDLDVVSLLRKIKQEYQFKNKMKKYY